jgi:hypothetical protein
MRVGERREGAKERAVVHSTAATAPTIAVVIAPTHRTPSPSSSSQVNGYKPSDDAMRICPRHHASRGGQCASNALRGSFGGQLPTDRREVRWGRTKVPI